MRPTNSATSTAINADADDKDDGEGDQDEEEVSNKTCRYLLKFSMFEPPHKSKSIYQRALPKEYKVTHCSVSDAYAIYAVVKET